MATCGNSLPLDPWGDAENCCDCASTCSNGNPVLQITDAEDVGTLSNTATIQYTRNEYNRIMSIRGVLGAGSGAYVVTFVINATLARNGDKIYATFALPASTNPTLLFQTQGVSGTFATCQPDGTATRYNGVFTFLNGSWYADDSWIS